ncbi:MAG: type II toxin-antitoxin system prevent-host-death family antitoxin [Elstera sp.]
MQTHEMTGREFVSGVATAKRLASDGSAVIITNHSKPTHVLLSVETYNRLVRDRVPTHLYFASEGQTDAELPSVRMPLRAANLDD